MRITKRLEKQFHQELLSIIDNKDLSEKQKSKAFKKTVDANVEAAFQAGRNPRKSWSRDRR